MHFLVLTVTLTASLLARATPAPLYISTLQSDGLPPFNLLPESSLRFLGPWLKSPANVLDKRAEPEDAKPKLTIGRKLGVSWRKTVYSAQDLGLEIYGRAYGRFAVAHTNRILEEHAKNVQELERYARIFPERTDRLRKKESLSARESLHELGIKLQVAENPRTVIPRKGNPKVIPERWSDSTIRKPTPTEIELMRKVRIPKGLDFETVGDVIPQFRDVMVLE